MKELHDPLIPLGACDSHGTRSSGVDNAKEYKSRSRIRAEAWAKLRRCTLPSKCSPESVRQHIYQAIERCVSDARTAVHLCDVMTVVGMGYTILCVLRNLTVTN